jgi:uncharacterized coiled-coil DUF342 family protein
MAQEGPAMIQETIAQLEQLTGALQNIADIDTATSAAQTKLAERDAVAKQVHDLTERARKLAAEIQALESQFAEVYERRNRVQGELNVAQEHLRQIREKVGA